MKKINFTIILTLITLTLAACGSPSPSSSSEAAPTGTPPVQEQIAVSPSPDGEFSNPSLTDSQREFCEKIIAAAKSKDLQADVYKRQGRAGRLPRISRQRRRK